jgi:transposase
MEEITTLGIDLAKRVFALHGVNARGRIVLRRVCRRHELAAIMAQLSPCLIGMEACSGAHEWGASSSASATRYDSWRPS